MHRVLSHKMHKFDIKRKHFFYLKIKEVLFMWGMLLGAIAGALMTIQGQMNTRLGEHGGFWLATAFVSFGAFLCSFLAVCFAREWDFHALFSAKPLYWFGGVLGFGITILVMLSMNKSGALGAVSAILTAQLLVAAVVDYFGLLGAEKCNFSLTQWIGTGLLVLGVWMVR